MKRVYVNEAWCLGCHLCEYNCAFANSGMKDMVKALKDRPVLPRIRVEGDVDRAAIYTAMIRNRVPLDSVDFEKLKNEPALAAFSKEYRTTVLGGTV